MTEVLTLDLTGWQPALPPGVQDAAIRALEGGGVVLLPGVQFALRDDERRFLSPAWSDGRAKNISIERRSSARRLQGPLFRARAALSALLAGSLLAIPDPSLGAEAHRLRRRQPTPVVRAARTAADSVVDLPAEAQRASASPREPGPVAPDVVLKGARGSADDLAALAAMIDRFAEQSRTLVATLFPRYAPYVTRARTSFRPQPAVGRDVSWRKDDSRLHVDAFPSRPNHGERILRVFSNLNPREPRVWRVGESFETMARTMLPRIKAPLPGSAAVLSALHVTKGTRSAYDHYMLGLHDRAKEDMAYQRACAQQVVPMPPGATWLCFSDQVMHAAVSGQYMLEQTIHLPVAALYDPARAPLATLERLTGRRLVPARAE